MFPLSQLAHLVKRGQLENGSHGFFVPNQRNTGHPRCHPRHLRMCLGTGLPQGGTLQTEVSLHSACSCPHPAPVISKPLKLKNVPGIAEDLPPTEIRNL